MKERKPVSFILNYVFDLYRWPGTDARGWMIGCCCFGSVRWWRIGVLIRPKNTVNVFKTDLFAFRTSERLVYWQVKNRAYFAVAGTRLASCRRLTVAVRQPCLLCIRLGYRSVLSHCSIVSICTVNTWWRRRVSLTTVLRRIGLINNSTNIARRILLYVVKY